MKIALKVTPGARRNELLGWEEQYPGIGRVLKLKIAAPPIDGRANKAIELYLAELLRVPKNSVRIVRGNSGHIKLAELPESADLSLLKDRRI